MGAINGPVGWNGLGKVKNELGANLNVLRIRTGCWCLRAMGDRGLDSQKKRKAKLKQRKQTYFIKALELF